MLSHLRDTTLAIVLVDEAREGIEDMSEVHGLHSKSRDPEPA